MSDSPITTPETLRVLPPITERQGRCLEFIVGYFTQHRYYPTQREVAKAMGIKSNTAEAHLLPLEQKGYLRRKPRQQRNIRLTKDAFERLRLMGVVGGVTLTEFKRR